MASYLVFDKFLHFKPSQGAEFNTLEEAKKDAHERLKISFSKEIKIYKIDLIEEVA